MYLRCLLLTCLCLSLSAATIVGFREVNGVVCMEAEHATDIRNWARDEGYPASGVTMRDDGGGQLSFRVGIENPGRYYVWFRMRKPEGATDKSNDCTVRVDGHALKVFDGTNEHEVIGMGTHQKRLEFESRPKTNENALRQYHPYFDVTQPKSTIEFTILSRSPGFLVDRVLLIHEKAGGNTERPAATVENSGMGPVETAIIRENKKK